MAVRIFHHYWQLSLALIALAEAVIGTLGLYFAGVLTGAVVLQGTGGIYRAVSFAATLFVSLAAVGLYNARQRSKFIGLVARIAIAASVTSVVLIAITKLLPQVGFVESTTVVAGVFALLGVTILRVIFERIVDDDIFKRRVLVFGAGKRAASIAQLRRRADRRGFLVMAYLRADGDDVNEADLPELLQLGAEKTLRDYCAELEIDEIVVAMDDRRRRFPMDQLLECRLDGIEVIELVTFLERETGKVRLDILNPSWMIFSTGFRRGRINAMLERAFDLGASAALLVVASPVLLLTVVAIKLEDGFGANIFYSQSRVGRYGRNFNLLKFRSMRADAERDGKPQWASKNDSRATRVGAFMRKTRIDEIPQILNVFRGEMSFVGPRPERPEFVSNLNETIPYYRERHAIKPGITGWAQLCYPYGSSEQDAVEKLQYDLYYVKNHSLIFYLAILLQTVEVIVWRKGAR